MAEDHVKGVIEIRRIVFYELLSKNQTAIRNLLSAVGKNSDKTQGAPALTCQPPKKISFSIRTTLALVSALT